MPYLTEPAFKHDSIARTGILLLNLGTPDAPTAAAVKPYLRQFLSDPRVVEIPRLVWWPILHGIILNTRPKKSAAKYASIWTREGSPLKVHTEALAKLLQGHLGEQIQQPIVVEYAMRYGNPSIESKIQQLKAQRCERILLVPLYPQYAASSTASALDEAFRVLQASRNMPEIRTIRHFHDQPDYIQALAQHIRQYWRSHGGRPDVLVMSFHGVPRFSLDKGDPYHCECRKTGRLLAEALELGPDDYRVTFQSRFGRAEWLKPYTTAVLEELGSMQTRLVDVVCPGFVADCLETLEEIAMEGKADFMQAGGKAYRYIPCLNTEPAWINAMINLIRPHLGGWINPVYDSTTAQDAAIGCARRAKALGAKA
jgi:ferrochelatase